MHCGILSLFSTLEEKMICYLHDDIVNVIEDGSLVIKVLIYQPWQVKDSYQSCQYKTQAVFQIHIYNGGWVVLQYPSQAKMPFKEELVLKNKEGQLISNQKDVQL